MGKLSASLRYVIDIAGKDPLSLGELGGRVNSKKLKKDIFLTYEGVTRS